MATLTIAIPLYNEGALARRFLEALDDACSALGSYEVNLLVVDDGSTDDTCSHVRQVKFRKIKSIRMIHLARNVGHPYAVQCLVDHLNAPLVIIMDADFQDDPSLIPELIRVYEEKKPDMVRVARSSQGGLPWVRAGYAGFRYLYKFLTGTPLHYGTYGLYTQKAVNHLKCFSKEAHRYFSGLVSLVGLKSETVCVDRKSRREGQSKVGTWGLVRLAFDAMFSFSTFPVRLGSAIGFVCTFLGACAIAAIVFIRLYTPYAIPGWSSLLAVVIFFGGMQMCFLGILGEYIARIFEQVKERPHYFVDSEEML